MISGPSCEALPLLLDAQNPFLLHEGDGSGEPLASPVQRRRRRLAGWVSLVLVVVVLASLVVSGSDRSSLVLLNEEAPSENKLLGGVTIVATNEYSTTRPVTAFDSYLFNGAAGEANRLLVEPARRTVLSLASTDALDASGRSFAVRWRLVAKHGADTVLVAPFSETEAEVTLLAPGRYRVEADVVFDGPATADVVSQGDPASGVGAFVMCVYVRRELRDLTAADRAAYAGAVAEMAQLTKADGIRKYGPSFRTVAELTKVHLLRGANRLSDELHDGVGFLPQHVALSNEFETSLQVVDPSIALPYWDFTRDYEKTMVAAPMSPASSSSSSSSKSKYSFQDLAAANPDIWSATALFGEVGGRTFRVPQVETDHDAFPFVDGISKDWPVGAVNAYGYMRSPWNMNRNPHVTKYGSFCGVERPVSDWPTCADHHTLTFGEPFATMHSYLRSAGGHPHGAVHMMLGGASQCASEVDDLRAAVANAPATTNQGAPTIAGGGAASLPPPHAGRSSSPPLNRSVAAPPRPTTTAAASYEDPVDDFIVHIKDVLQALWRFHVIDFPTKCSADEPVEDCHAICDQVPTLDGDPSDDAAVEWWRQNVFENERVGAFMPQLVALPQAAIPHAVRAICLTPWSFGEQAGAESPLDPSFWPMHPTLDRLLQYKRLVNDFADGEWATSTSALCKYAKTSPCLGHREHDLTSFKSTVLNDDGTFSTRYLTNSEVVQMTDPRQYRMKYVYDNFDWTHCAEDFAPVGPARR